MIVKNTAYSIQRIICFLIASGFCSILSLYCKNKAVKISDPLEKNMVLSGKNRGELEKVIAHFKRDPDSLKLKAAILLLSNMEDKIHYTGDWLRQMDSLFFNRAGDLDEEGLVRLRDTVFDLIGSPGQGDIGIVYDLQTLSSSFLIQNIELAFTAWQSAPWKDSVSFNAFCNYILPYKTYDEYPEDWRTRLKDRYAYILDDPNIPKTMLDICCAMVDEQKKWLHFSDEPLGYPAVRSISLILNMKKGSCEEWSGFGAEAARAFGIPVAIDFAPQYGNRYTNHNWDALILSDDHFISFLGAESRPGDHGQLREGETKFAKVFRLQLVPNTESFAFKARQAGITEIPDYLADTRIKDVTGYYTLVSDLKIDIHGPPGKPLYLCIFKNWNWQAIAGGFIDHGTVRFPQMGRTILYIPMYYDHGNYLAAGPPIGLMADDKIVEYKAAVEGDMVLKRKYPFKRTEEWIREHSLQDARFEGDNDPEFTHPKLLYYVLRNVRPYRGSRVNNLAIKDQWVYDSLWREIPVHRQDSFQYLRLRFKKGHEFKIGEIEFYTPGIEHPLPGTYLGNVPEPKLAFDGFPGKCIKLPVDTSKIQWVGLDLGKKMPLSKIKFIPADDDNFVEPGKNYELFYWKNKWVSAGAQKAEADSLYYKKVPQGGIYFLRCRDCTNNEQRPFTYENGKQVWW